MSTVLWMILENDDDDFAPDDLAALYASMDALDEQCADLSVAALSDFVDFSDMELNVSEEDMGEEEAEQWLADHAKWVKPAELLATLRVLEQALAEAGDDEELIEDLRYCIERCETAEQDAVSVRLIAVM